VATLAQSQPTGARALQLNSVSDFIQIPIEIDFLVYLFNNVFQLHNGYTHKAVISSEAIILDADVKFKGFKSFLIADGTVRQKQVR
jgi:hypothetical protein